MADRERDNKAAPVQASDRQVAADQSPPGGSADHQARRVLYITPQPFFEWRGSPIRVSYAVRALAELGYEVDLLALPVGADRQIEGVEIYRAPNWLGIKKVSIGPSIKKAFLDVFLFFKALRMGRRNRYAVIHGVEEAGAIAVVGARLSGSRAIFEKHSDPSSYRKGPLRNLVLWLYSRVERFSIRRANAVIATGPGLVEQARRVEPKASVHHIFDIPSSLAEADAGRSAQVRRRLQAESTDKLALYVGSFAVYQGIDLMFESIPLVVAKSPEARFVIIGGTAQQIEGRRRWLAERGSDQAVEFVGTVDPDVLPDYLAAADLLLSPRIAGTNTPLKILDYLKAGRAIVAVGSDANRLILDEKIALLTEPASTAFAAGISVLLEDDQRRELLAASGRRLIEERYNFTEFKRLIGRCYDEVLETK
jgi:glycosyltransferase involved in cell wall biosynthesis